MRMSAAVRALILFFYCSKNQFFWWFTCHIFC